MNERSENAGVVVAVGLALILVMIVVVGGGIAFWVFARQASAIRAEAAMARAAQAEAEQNRAQAEVIRQLTVAKHQSAELEKEAQKPDASTDEAWIAVSVEQVLLTQQQTWNDGNIDRFMDHYWKSDNLTFSSGGQTTRGWDETLKRYRDRYPTPEKMGKLKFDNLEVTPLGNSAALVLGQWHLERETEPLNGNFSLVVRKIDDRWLIVHDHTSRSEK